MAVNYIDSGLGWAADEAFYKRDHGTVSVINGQTYYTYQDGPVVFATVYNGANTGPVILSTRRDLAAYEPGGVIAQGRFNHLGFTWYITAFSYWASGDQSDSSGISRKIAVSGGTYADIGTAVLRAASVLPSEYSETSKTKIFYNGNSKVIRRLCQIINSVARLGTSHTTAFYGDLGQEAYEHSQTMGNPHGTSLSDLGIESIQRQIDLLTEAVGASESWICHMDDAQITDHDNNEFVFGVGSNLLKWH